ncbi:DUF4245 domain-containing protein [Kitasatospora sp. SolWspMP-SS2h]|uniref:DUF4245 domain-containing protein n=1 Tax=Kitasatospora sp. SolWspMP-SS2h TaxID=1305729 RepID=UPI001F2C8D6A|nr:DUF4245 domain-containing protein [Kitasatospora sp. SolWspMP-SS2h]
MAGNSSNRGRQTVRDMVLSMAAVGVVVVVAYFSIPSADGKNGVHAVPYQVELASAKRAAPYPLLGPEQLPDGWKATSVSYGRDDKGRAAWHLGLNTASGQYAAVEQSDGKSADVVALNVPGAEPDGTATVAGQEWQRVRGDRYRALVRPAGDTGTTVLTGTASYEELARLAETLR